MFTSLFQSTTIPVLQEVVSFAQARQAVLAGNIANIDTPGYQTRDLSVEDFQTRLKQAMDRARRTDAPLAGRARLAAEAAYRRGRQVVADWSCGTTWAMWTWNRK